MGGNGVSGMGAGKSPKLIRGVLTGAVRTTECKKAIDHVDRMADGELNAQVLRPQEGRVRLGRRSKAAELHREKGPIGFLAEQELTDGFDAVGGTECVLRNHVHVAEIALEWLAAADRRSAGGLMHQLDDFRG